MNFLYVEDRQQWGWLAFHQAPWLTRFFLLRPFQTEVLCVPKNMKIIAVSLFELYDNSQRYGPQLAAIPHLLSRYNFEYVDENGNVVAVTPGGGPIDDGGQSIPIPSAKVLSDGGADDAENGQAAVAVNGGDGNDDAME